MERKIEHYSIVESELVIDGETVPSVACVKETYENLFCKPSKELDFSFDTKIRKLNESYRNE